MKRFAWFAVAGAALLSACGGVRSPDFIPKLQGIQISPTTSTVNLGGTAQFVVTEIDTTPPGSATSASKGNVITGASYAVDNPSAATIDSSGLLRGLKRGSVTVTATANGFTSSAVVSVEGFVLTSIFVTPPAPVTLAAGQTQAYTTLGEYTDQSGTKKTTSISETVSWTSGTPSQATVSPAQGQGTTAQTLAPGGGKTSITASATNFEGTLITKSVTLNVNPPVLTDLVITPVPANTPQPFILPVGATLTFAVQGIYSDSPTPRPVSSSASPITWVSNHPANGSLSSPTSNTQNVLTANAIGAVVTITVSAPDGNGNTITSTQPLQITISPATLRDVTAIVAVSGSSPLTVAKGAINSLKAQGQYTDASLHDLADSTVSWIVTNGTGQASITTYSSTPATAGGFLSGVGVGNVTVTATVASARGIPSVSAVIPVTDPICVVPYVAPDTTASTSAACLSDRSPVPAGQGSCGVHNSDNVVSPSLTDYATITLGIALPPTATNSLTVTTATARSSATGQQAGFIIAFNGTDFNPASGLTISAGSSVNVAPTVSSLGTTSDGLNLRLVAIPVTGSITSMSVQTVPLSGPASNPTGLPSLLQRGGTTDVRIYSACSTAVPPP